MQNRGTLGFIETIPWWEFLRLKINGFFMVKNVVLCLRIYGILGVFWPLLVGRLVATFFFNGTKTPDNVIIWWYKF